MLPYREYYASEGPPNGQQQGPRSGAWRDPNTPQAAATSQPPTQQSHPPHHQQPYWPPQQAGSGPAQVYMAPSMVASVPQQPQQTAMPPMVWSGGFGGPLRGASSQGQNTGLASTTVDAFPTFAAPQGPPPPSQSAEAPVFRRGLPPFYMQSAYEGGSANISQQQSEPPTAGATFVAPSGLRSAVNAPQFVPKPTPSPLPVASPPLQGVNSTGATLVTRQQQQQQQQAGGPGNLKSSAQAFEPGANLNRLAVQAAPFVPGGASRSKSTDGLSNTAAPFQPGSTRENGTRPSFAYGGRGEGARNGGGGGGGGQASSGYYPADEGYGEEEEAVEEEAGSNEIFDWSVGASSLPAPARKTVGRMGVPEQLRQFFLVKDLDRLRAMPADDERYKEIPPKYHLAYPLDDEKTRGIAGAFGYPSFLYKVVSQDDGNTYALRRFDNVRTTPKIVQSVVETWRSVQHPNIIRLCRAFVQHGALFFVHEYFPLAQSVYQRYIVPRSSGQRLPEKLLWSFIVQLLSAIRAVHASGAACRMIHPNYVLLTSGNRIRLGCMGVNDVLESETRKSLKELQKDDLFYLGRLIVMLATRTFLTPQNFTSSLSSIGQTFSPEFHNLVVQLCTSPPSVFDLTSMLTRHIMDELDRQYVAVDDLDTHLSSEYENGRLLRLSMKLSTLIEKPTDAMNPAWEEAGNRYVLKLFRDYVYHQMDEEGNPVVDFGHIVHTLNKLDTGDPEKIVLMSRDQQTMIIVSFEDVKRCLENAWVELCSTATTAPHIAELAPSSGSEHEGGDADGRSSTIMARGMRRGL